jgi:hypothetical protein
MINSESNWKKSKPVHRLVVRRYSERSVAAIQAIANDTTIDIIDRFFDLRDLAEKLRKESRMLNNGLTRSSMPTAMMLFYRDGLLTREDIVEFSQELQDWITHEW